jgi:hypothetical protein
MNPKLVQILYPLTGVFVAGSLAAIAMPKPGQTIQAQPVPVVSLFTDIERAQIATYWNTPGRQNVQPPPDIAKVGLWQVRLTQDGSVWFHKYQIAIGAAKAPPTQDPATLPVTSALATSTWKPWVDAKLAYDRWQAQAIADASNAMLQVGKPLNRATDVPPPPPGPIPADLQAACGDPPSFASAVTPMQTIVTFDDGDTYPYLDNIKLPKSYAYYRFPQGTDTDGTPLRNMSDAELAPLFTAAGFTDSEQRICRCVSKLEGGFDAINTYDTGYVSIGFVQFITAVDGRGSLLEVLAREKQDKPDDYVNDFHRYGIDVTPDVTLQVVDPATGAVLTGPDAVQRTIADKRLTAIWQRAGKHSTAFRVAQIQVAKSHYWPADDPITITVNGQVLTGKVSDVIRSEAGLTTLFDRKVNRGKIDPFRDVLTKVMIAHNLTSLADAVEYEREIVQGCKYRTDFLAEPTLSQPK